MPHTENADADSAAERVGAAVGLNLTRDTFEECFRKIRTAKREADEARGRYQAARKAAKDAGVDMPALALMEQLAKLDEEEVNQRLGVVFRYAGWLELNIGTQLDMFGAEPRTQKAEVEQREWAAEEAGKAGPNRNDENPYPPGSPLHVKWDAGWLKGQAIIADQMGPARKRAATTRKRREPPKRDDGPAPASR